jgi:hypothetical protein
MYDTKELERKALEAIKEHKLMFIEHVVAYLPCAKKTFYEHNLHESNAIKRAIEENRTSKKVALLNNWIKETSAPVLQIAAMKMISSDEEAHRLNGTKREIKHDTKQKSFKVEVIDNNTSK